MAVRNNTWLALVLAGVSCVSAVGCRTSKSNGSRVGRDAGASQGAVPADLGVFRAPTGLVRVDVTALRATTQGRVLAEAPQAVFADWDGVRAAQALQPCGGGLLGLADTLVVSIDVLEGHASYRAWAHSSRDAVANTRCFQSVFRAALGRPPSPEFSRDGRNAFHIPWAGDVGRVVVLDGDLLAAPAAESADRVADATASQRAAGPHVALAWGALEAPPVFASFDLSSLAPEARSAWLLESPPDEETKRVLGHLVFVDAGVKWEGDQVLGTFVLTLDNEAAAVQLEQFASRLSWDAKATRARDRVTLRVTWTNPAFMALLGAQLARLRGRLADNGRHVRDVIVIARQETE